MKKTLREKLLRKRNRIGPEEKKKKNAALRKRLYGSADFRKAAGILFYASFRSEVDTVQCIKHALKLKKEVILPRVDKSKRELRLFKIDTLDDLKAGYMGIPEPEITKSGERRLRDIDMVIVPGAGFDAAGNRLGYGAGYYDRLLSGRRGNIVTVAIAFEEQVVPAIPAERHDVKMDKLITEKRTINCKKIRGKGQARNPVKAIFYEQKED